MTQDELRERLIVLLGSEGFHTAKITMGQLVGATPIDDEQVYGPRADAILAEIEAAGYVLVERACWEDAQDWAAAAGWDADAECGDLDPLP